jgi:3-oxoacyl-[acyl-carrier protein] reductase
MSQPDQETTLVTGASRGIGRHLVKHFLAQGHFVIGCSRSEGDLTDPAYTHFVCDVSDETKVKEVFSLVRKKHGRLDNLINNAGIASMNHSLTTPLTSIREILETNFVGTFLFCREAAKLMQRRKFGRIVNFTTIAVPLRLPGETAYASSKAAVEMLTRILAFEYAPYSITVNALGPGPVATALLRNVPETTVRELMNRQAVKRMVELEDVTNVVDFFLRPASGMVTGQVLYLGGL